MKAYFDLKLNKERKLENEEDYQSIAKACYREANGFYNIYYRCRDMWCTENMFALYANASFACELYFKCLLYDAKIAVKGHGLYNLYCKLPPKIKQKVKEIHPCGNIQRSDFENELKKLNDAFTVFRYRFERGNLAWNSLFLIELVTSLHDNIVDTE